MHGDSPSPTDPATGAWLDVGHGHRLIYMVSGRANGVPIVLLHGGPGSGSTTRQRRFLDENRFRIIQFDQRGSGRSEPAGETEHNNTPALIEDIERLRIHLGIERWLVCGGSWGSSLALAYADRHKDRVTGLILRGMFLADASDIEWFFEGVGALAPAAHEAFLANIPQRWRRRLVTYLDRTFIAGDPEKCARLAAAWQRYELALSGADVPMTAPTSSDTGNAALCAKYKIQAHYLAHACFLGTHALVRAAANLRGVPVALIHGSLDRVCRPLSAWRIHRACAGSKLAWAQGAGHDPFHPAMQALLSSAAVCFADHGDFSRWPEST